MADFSYAKNTVKTISGIGTPSDVPRGTKPAEFTSTKNSELLLLEEVIKTLFPQYTNTEAKITVDRPKSSGALAAYDPVTSSVLLGNLALGGDVEYKGQGKENSKASFNQMEFTDNLLTVLHELGHAQRSTKSAVSADQDFSVPGAKMTTEKYSALQEVLDFAAGSGFPSMSKNAFGNRSLEEFLVEVQALKDVKEAGFNLPKSQSDRLRKIEVLQSKFPWLDNYIKSQNRPDAPTLKEKSPNFMTYINRIFTGG